jgi:hypothetical protein
MLTTDQINQLHRLYWSEHWPIRKIERHLKLSWRSIKKYLEAPAQTPAKRARPSKLDAFKGNIAEWIEKDPHVTGAVIEQRLQPLGYRGCAHANRHLCARLHKRISAVIRSSLTIARIVSASDCCKNSNEHPA